MYKKVIYSKYEPSNKEVIWFNGKTFKVFLNGKWNKTISNQNTINKATKKEAGIVTIGNGLDVNDGNIFIDETILNNIPKIKEIDININDINSGAKFVGEHNNEYNYIMLNIDNNNSIIDHILLTKIKEVNTMSIYICHGSSAYYYATYLKNGNIFISQGNATYWDKNYYFNKYLLSNSEISALKNNKTYTVTINFNTKYDSPIIICLNSIYLYRIHDNIFKSIVNLENSEFECKSITLEIQGNKSIITLEE